MKIIALGVDLNEVIHVSHDTMSLQPDVLYIVQRIWDVRS